MPVLALNLVKVELSETVSVTSFKQEGHHFLSVLYMVYINRMVSTDMLVFMLSEFPVKDILEGGVSRDKLLAWLRQEQDLGGEKKHYIPILAKLLELEFVRAINIEVKRKESVEETSENIQPVVLPDMVKTVQEFLIQETGALLDRLNGSLAGKVVESIISLSGMLSSLVVGGIEQSNTTTKVATLVKHIISKVKRESRSVELLPNLNQWFSLIRGKEYRMDCINFLHSKDTESKLEWCVGDICMEKDRVAIQVGNIGRAANGSVSEDPFDAFCSDSIETAEETDFDKTGKANTAKEALELKTASSCLLVLTTFSSPRGEEDTQDDTYAAKQVKLLIAQVANSVYNEASLVLVFTICHVLVSVNLSRETVMEMCEMLKEMTRNKFKYPRILCLQKMLFLLTPAFQQLSDQSIRGVCLKILQGLVSQRDDCVLGRLGPDIIVHLCRTVAELVRVIWTHNNKVVIMDCPTLNMNTHEKQLVSGSIPGFLAAKSAVLEIFLISGIKASFHTSRDTVDTVDTMKSLAGSASALLLSFTSTSMAEL